MTGAKAIGALSALALVAALPVIGMPSVATAHHCGPTQPLPEYPRHSCRTHTQTWQPGERVDPHPGGAAGRGTGLPILGVQGQSVHCQLEADGRCVCGPRRGTGRNIPCRPGQTAAPPPQPSPPPPRQCSAKPYDVREDVPDADANLRYVLGFERGFAMCQEEQTNILNLALAAAAAKFREIAALLVIAAAPGVVDAVLHPPGLSPDPNPYLRGKDEGRRLCEWAMKISPAMIARCPGALRPSRGASCSAAQVAQGYGSAAAAANSHGPKRFDCYPCSKAWVKGEPYTPPADGGRPWTLTEIIADLVGEAGAKTPQGPALPCWREKPQIKGYPVSMSPGAIETEMKAAGDGAKGLVFFIDPLTGDVGHVFAVKTIGTGRNARAVHWDEQQQMDGKLWFADGQWTGWWVSFFRLQ